MQYVLKHELREKTVRMSHTEL